MSDLQAHLAVLADPTRVRLLAALEREELDVGELTRVVGAPQSQHSDLHLQGFGVGRGDLGERDLVVDDLPDRGEVHAQVAQCSHEVQARDGFDVVEAVARRAAVGRRHDPAVGVESDGLDRQAGSPGQVARHA